MVRIDRFIFGYRKIWVSKEHLQAVISLFLRHKIQSDVDASGTIIVRERDYIKIRGLLDGTIPYSSSDTLGIYGAYKKIRYKKTIFITSFLMMCLLLTLSNLVWDIRISGNESLADSEILYKLSENGFSIGKFWPNCDRSEIENEMLLSENRIGWININRRGSVAYVEVIESDVDKYKENSSEKKYSNIVANADCVIEEITVFHGVAVVKPGDVVKKGDLLISGVLTADEGICNADGIVKGRMTDTVTVSTERIYQ